MFYYGVQTIKRSVGRGALTPPQPCLIAYCKFVMALAQFCRGRCLHRPARRALLDISTRNILLHVRGRTMCAPTGGHPVITVSLFSPKNTRFPIQKRQCRIKTALPDWLSMRCPRRPCSWRACRRPGIRRTGAPARTACSGWKALLRSSWLPHRPGRRTTWF